MTPTFLAGQLFSRLTISCMTRPGWATVLMAAIVIEGVEGRGSLCEAASLSANCLLSPVGLPSNARGEEVNGAKQPRNSQVDAGDGAAMKWPQESSIVYPIAASRVAVGLKNLARNAGGVLSSVAQRCHGVVVGGALFWGPEGLANLLYSSTEQNFNWGENKA